MSNEMRKLMEAVNLLDPKAGKTYGAKWPHYTDTEVPYAARFIIDQAVAMGQQDKESILAYVEELQLPPNVTNKIEEILNKENSYSQEELDEDEKQQFKNKLSNYYADVDAIIDEFVQTFFNAQEEDWSKIDVNNENSVEELVQRIVHQDFDEMDAVKLAEGAFIKMTLARVKEELRKR